MTELLINTLCRELVEFSKVVGHCAYHNYLGLTINNLEQKNVYTKIVVIL
jgi:hypothetical protein